MCNTRINIKDITKFKCIFLLDYVFIQTHTHAHSPLELAQVSGPDILLLYYQEVKRWDLKACKPMLACSKSLATGATIANMCKIPSFLV